MWIVISDIHWIFELGFQEYWITADTWYIDPILDS